jgi:hypothetical protein
MIGGAIETGSPPRRTLARGGTPYQEQTDRVKPQTPGGGDRVVLRIRTVWARVRQTRISARHRFDQTGARQDANSTRSWCRGGLNLLPMAGAATARVAAASHATLALMGIGGEPRRTHHRRCRDRLRPHHRRCRDPLRPDQHRQDRGDQDQATEGAEPSRRIRGSHAVQ